MQPVIRESRSLHRTDILSQTLEKPVALHRDETSPDAQEQHHGYGHVRLHIQDLTTSSSSVTLRWQSDNPLVCGSPESRSKVPEALRGEEQTGAAIGFGMASTALMHTA